MRVEAFGETKPIAPNVLEGKDNPEGRALNRRVELTAQTRDKVKVLPKAQAPRAVAPKRVPAPKAKKPKRIRAPKVKRPPTIIPPRYDKNGNLVRPGKRIDYDN